MVREQIEARGVDDPAVLLAMLAVPRERFVPIEYEDRAYDDSPLPIGWEQTISQPYIVALMAAALRLRPDDRALEIGSGSGYAAAVLSRLARDVFTVEIRDDLADAARRRLADLGIGNVHVRAGDGSAGWPEHAPYDAIVVTACAPEVPPALLAQLSPGGRLVMPVGVTRAPQRLVRIARGAGGEAVVEDFGSVRFVPLLGRGG